MLQEINRLAEYKDKIREKEFFGHEVARGLRVSRNIILIFSIVNLLFVITDYLYLKYENISIIIYYSLIPRAIILAMAVAVFILLKKTRNPAAAIHSVLVFAVLMYLLHEYIAMHFAPVDPIFEALDLVLITFGLFIIPNRWIANICASVFLVAVFIAFTPLTIPTMESGTKTILMIYLTAQNLIVGTLMYRINVQKRLNHLQRLQLEELAKTDVLTKAPNRAACDRTLELMCEAKSDFSIILIDLDDFKQINDMHGHIAGDEVIVHTIDTVKKTIRQDDIVARWGGEEFVVILPHTALERASEIAGRIRETTALLEHGGGIGRVTASIGVTAFAQGDDTKSILNRADQLLYAAKKDGKNKVITG